MGEDFETQPLQSHPVEYQQPPKKKKVLQNTCNEVNPSNNNRHRGGYIKWPFSGDRNDFFIYP